MSDSFDKSPGDGSPGNVDVFPETTVSGDAAGTAGAPAIDYPALVQGALRRVVRDVLSQVADLGLPAAHHFYISFASTYPGVGLSDALRSKHPEEMTIVLQHDYRDLEVDDEGFDVTLRFGGIPQSVRVPFDALTAFFDPAVHFMLRFEGDSDGIGLAEHNDDAFESSTSELSTVEPAASPRRIPTEVLRQADASSRARSKARAIGDSARVAGEDQEKQSEPGGEIVSFEAFRRK